LKTITQFTKARVADRPLLLTSVAIAIIIIGKAIFETGAASLRRQRWAFNLLNVRNHPAYEDNRWFYLMNYAQAGCSAGLIM